MDIISEWASNDLPLIYNFSLLSLSQIIMSWVFSGEMAEISKRLHGYILLYCRNTSWKMLQAQTDGCPALWKPNQVRSNRCDTGWMKQSRLNRISGGGHQTKRRASEETDRPDQVVTSKTITEAENAEGKEATWLTAWVKSHHAHNKIIRMNFLATDPKQQ